MSTANDLLGDEAKKALRIALTTAGASLTDAQIRVLSHNLAFSSAQQIEALLRSAVPPEMERLGILLPLLVPGKNADYAHFARVLVFYALAVQAGVKDEDFSKFIQDALVENLTVGTLGYYASKGDERMSSIFHGWLAAGVLPTEAHAITASIDARRIWAATGLSPSEIGTGVSGGSEFKGRNAAVPESIAHVQASNARSGAVDLRTMTKPEEQLPDDLDRAIRPR